jgi:imidazolonepropionase-like amidohydrolase
MMVRTALLASIGLAIAGPASAGTQAIIVGNLISDAASGPADDAALKVMKANGTVLVPPLIALEAAGRQVSRAKAIGVIVAFGTDAGVFEHGRNGGEFALLVKAGMTPTEGLASATTVAAKALGMENEIGRIAVGYSADLVAVGENPLANIRTLEKPEWVMVRGRIVP